MNFRLIERILSYSFIILLLFVLFAYYMQLGLPKKNELVDRIAIEPVQKEISETPYTMKYKTAEYQIDPLYEYEISGVVVSQNNINSLFDWYHDKNSVDIKDLCIIWGDNAFLGNFSRREFRSEAWTCFFEPTSQASMQRFNANQISNNHLLSEYKHVREKIKSVNVGDQINLKGKLINYWPKRYSEQIRKTSITRNDTGNNACEVILVDQLDILKPWKPFWRTAFNLTIKMIYAVTILRILAFIFFPYAGYNKP